MCSKDYCQNCGIELDGLEVGLCNDCLYRMEREEATYEPCQEIDGYGRSDKEIKDEFYRKWGERL